MFATELNSAQRLRHGIRLSHLLNDERKVVMLEEEEEEQKSGTHLRMAIGGRFF